MAIAILMESDVLQLFKATGSFFENHMAAEESNYAISGNDATAPGGQLQIDDIFVLQWALKNLF